jgi:hypothetical protein
MTLYFLLDFIDPSSTLRKNDDVTPGFWLKAIVLHKCHLWTYETKVGACKPALCPVWRMPRELATAIARYWFYSHCLHVFVMAIPTEVRCSRTEPHPWIPTYEIHPTITVLSAFQFPTCHGNKSHRWWVISARNSSINAISEYAAHW